MSEGLGFFLSSCSSSHHGCGLWHQDCANAYANLFAHAYLAAGHKGLYLIDISDPAHPRELSSVSMRCRAAGIAVEGGVAYVVREVVGRGTGLCLVDVSRPSAPVKVGFFGTGYSSVVSAAAADSMVFVTSASSGLYILRNDYDGTDMLRLGRLTNPTFPLAQGIEGRYIAIGGVPRPDGGPNEWPNPGAQFEIRDSDNRHVTMVVTDSEGAFHVQLPEGDYLLCKEDGFCDGPITVKTGKFTFYQLTLALP